MELLLHGAIIDLCSHITFGNVCKKLLVTEFATKKQKISIYKPAIMTTILIDDSWQMQRKIIA